MAQIDLWRVAASGRDILMLRELLDIVEGRIRINKTIDSLELRRLLKLDASDFERILAKNGAYAILVHKCDRVHKLAGGPLKGREMVLLKTMLEQLRKKQPT